jgi:hypothetical protein
MNTMTRLSTLASMTMMTIALLAVPTAASADGKTTPGSTGTTKATTAKKLAVKRLTLAHGIENHEPQEATTSFRASDDRVYAFVELENPGRAEDAITVVFQPPSGPALAEIPLKVGESPRFRTWAFTRRAHDAGEWGVVIRDASGRVLARQTFTVAK